eukprot:TRINITY_DN26494_c0_g1_i2.p1 TRINITY_DN26494_c0_g1~~TRINITY_DN26494_c0_g1_i2.p1  ORF type:complete len:168 (-),score=32.63 TRINITY_DN26494_c0_g1_i2:51-515(-)
MSASQPQSIPITSLSIQQLAQVKEQVESEVKMLVQSLNKLKVASNKFLESKQTLDEFNTKNVGREVLTPLTSSLYVKGNISEVEHVFVDIGTGYYIKKDIKGSQEFIDRKLRLIQVNIDQVQVALMSKKNSLEQIIYVLQEKVAQSQDQPQQAA